MSTSPDQTAQELRKKIASTWLTRDDGLSFRVELPPDQVDDLLALMYRENLAVIGEPNCESGTPEQNRYANVIIMEMRQVAAKRYGQIRSEE